MRNEELEFMGGELSRGCGREDSVAMNEVGWAVREGLERV